MKLLHIQIGIGFFIAAILLVISYFFVFTEKKDAFINSQVTAFAPEESKSTQNNPQLGRLIMVGHFAGTPVASTTALIKELHVGGVIIMSAPKDTQEIKEWTAAWQVASDFPLLISIDQEGGPVSRLKDSDFTQTGQQEISTSEAAYQLGLTRGQELASLGINMNFAPVLDRAENKDSFMFSRTFPSTSNAPDLAASMYRGMEDTGVIAVAKHFPGHDDTRDDSHEVLPVVSVKKEELDGFTKNFRDYIVEAKPRALMTAHVQFPEIDSLPATLSYYFLTTYLRNELGFTGMIITDDMSMNAIDENWNTSEATLLSLKAGADMVLFAAEPEKARAALKAIKKAVIENDLYAEDVSEKISRQQKVLAN